MPRLTKKQRLIQHFGLTDEDIRTIQSGAHAVWNDIGYDCLQAVADDQGKDVNSVTVSRAVVIELVLDASRLDDYLKRGSRRSPLSPAIVNLLDKQYSDTDAHALMGMLMRDTFTYARWGM